MNKEPPTITGQRRAGRLLRYSAICTLCVLAACQTSPPVQEMSDARQAIAAAIDAGAASMARTELQKAEEHLATAEQRISEKSYTAARREAMNAKQDALDALAIAEQEQGEDPD